MRITPRVRSDQWNADDFIGGPRTFTIAGATEGKAEGPYDIELVEGEGRVWRPPNSVISALALVWGTDESADWSGRRVTLFRDASVKFGNDQPGGIRVSHVSHLDKETTVRVTVSRGRKAPVTLKPLTDAPRAEPVTIPDTLPGPSADDIAACTDAATLRTWWTANPSMRDQIAARKAELDATAEDPPATGLAAAKAALHGEQGELA